MATSPLPPGGHVVVCGLHDEGLTLVQQLTRVGVPAIVVEQHPDPRLLAALDRLGTPHLRADPRLPATLEAAGLRTCTALVCVESDDVRTLATALLARELRPDLQVVVQLRNAAVGRALEGIGVSVLDVARLAVPSIVAACLGTGRRELRLPGLDLVVAEGTCVRPGTLRGQFGDLAPIALVHADGTREISPSRATEVVPGDRAVVVGTHADLDRVGLGEQPSRASERPVFVGARAPRPRRDQRAWWVDVVRALDRRIPLVVGALASIAGLSVVVLGLGYREADGTRMSPLDALYFTVETMATVGYGDFSFREQDPWLRFWAIGLMALGATTVAIFFALVTNALVTRQIETTLGRRRITGMREHVVVVGLGSMGLGVVRGLLDAGVPAVVVEADPDNRLLGEVRSLGVPVLVADATLPDTWSEVHLDTARAVAVMTSEDLVNLEAGLAARDLLGDRLGAVPVVLRLFDQSMVRTVAGGFGFRDTRSPAVLAAPWFVGEALGLQVVDTFYVGSEPMLVARMAVSDALVGLRMRELGADIRVVALVRRGGEVVSRPGRDTCFEPGDAAYLVGPDEELLTLLRADEGGR
ncbi:NAD-binding protein [Nocardioides sp. GY 10127]|uniref:NAD-binding protein n=1 Tax=Nocardioides sp. GY 10127 TaxID=2569762 RepID=UPI0010A7F193|nr:NAD-binding protein [Nocardioides sp. GY 10127]TIC81717.1 potassium transporter TrkA [Nocardioides sp. GY 10127]